MSSKLPLFWLAHKSVIEQKAQTNKPRFPVYIQTVKQGFLKLSVEWFPYSLEDF